MQDSGYWIESWLIINETENMLWKSPLTKGVAQPGDFS